MDIPRQRLLRTFLAELDQRAGELDRDLLALERETAADARQELFKSMSRTAHNLKGAAAAAAVATIELACHGLEEVIGAVRDGRLAPAPEIFRLFFACVDGLRDAGQRLGQGRDLVAAPLALLLPQLTAEIGRRGAADALAARRGERAPATAEPPRPPREEAVVRVAAQKLDMLLARSGELLFIGGRLDLRLEEIATVQTLAKSRGGDRAGPLGLVAKSLDRLSGALAEDRRTVAQAVKALDAEVRRVRQLPFSAACAGLERMLRDLCRASGKEAELVVAGADIELDRSIIEGLRDPLRHLVRNAVDHGVETVAARLGAGKPSAGRIVIAAALSGAGVAVSVADDGPGLDVASIRARAAERGLPLADDRALARYVLLPGFTTAASVTAVSGRGVGLDAVKTAVEAMRGSLELAFEPGRGTRFTLALPLTLTTIRALLVAVAGDGFALDMANIVRLLRVDRAQLRALDGRTIIVLDDGPAPVVPLAALLGLDGERPAASSARLNLVIIAAEGRRIALLVDSFAGEQEILVRPLGRRFVHVRHIAGGTVLPTGRIAFILDAVGLVRSAFGGDLPAVPERAPAAAAARTRVLLADDSLTTRSLERSILEVAGYEVIAAADGDEAWRLLQEQGADVVVSDVEMPRMDGFAFTEAIRASSRFKELPVILVTARSSDEDKMRGLRAGANCYIVKSAFEQKSLLEAIAQFV